MLKRCLILIFLLFTGCATFPANKLQYGQTIEDVKRSIAIKPSLEKNIPSTENPENEHFTALVYNSLYRTKTYSYDPYWFLFYENKLALYGLGYIQNAEYSLYRVYVSILIGKKEITQGQGERLLYDKFKLLFGSDPLSDELFDYNIMVADRLDKGEISSEEANYLVAQKAAEIGQRSQAMRYKQAQSGRWDIFWSFQQQMIDYHEGMQNLMDMKNIKIKNLFH